MKSYITWNYRRNYAAGEQARQKFKDKAIRQHSFGKGVICVLECQGMNLSPQKLLALMDALGFEALLIYSSLRHLSNTFLLKMYILNEMKYKMQLLDFPSYSIIKKWRAKRKTIKRYVDLEDECITEIESNLNKLPAIFANDCPRLYRNPDLTRLMTYRECITIKPSDYKNISFTDEADETISGSWYIQEENLLVTTKQDFKKEILRVQSYSKKDKYPNLTLRQPNLDNYKYSKFNIICKKSKERRSGTLSNGINYYCYNLPYEYYSQHKTHFRELFYDSEEKTWKSSSKSGKHLKELIDNIAKEGFKCPLCFALAKNGQLIPIGCHTRIMIACFLNLPTIPAVILTIPETYEGDKNINNIKLANRYLNPNILFL